MIKRLIQNIRMSKEFNLFFVLCFSLGIVGLILVESFKAGVEEKVSKNAKNFIASDLSISARRQFSDLEKKIVDEFTRDNSIEHSAWLETYSLISLKDHSKLAALNFVDKNFPFYGGVKFEDNTNSVQGDWQNLIQSDGIWMSRDLAWELGAKIGDQIKVGESSFVLTKIFTTDQFSSFRGFNLAPKVFLSKIKLHDTLLMSFGSTGTDSFLLKLPASYSENDVLKLKTTLRNILKDPGIKIKGPKESSEQVGRSLNYLSDYLGLITLLTYILSLIGLYYFTHYFLSRSLKNIAIFKALGLKTTIIFSVTLIHLLVLSLISLAMSALLMKISLPVLETVLSNKMGEVIYLKMNFWVLGRVGSFSIVGCLLVLLPIVYGAVKIPVSVIFQDLPKELSRISILYYTPLFLYVVMLSILISHSIKIGLIFIIALFTLMVFGFIFFKVICLLLSKMSEHIPFVFKHGILAMTRYFNSSFTIFLSLILGTTLIVLILQVESTLRNEFSTVDSTKRPDLFIFDLQDDQGKKFVEELAQKNIKLTMFSPMIRGRLVRINSETILAKKNEIESGFETRESENQERFRTRGVNLSFRDKLSWSEKIVKGKMYKGRCEGEAVLCEISLEESYARRMSVNLGDKLVFDISGVEVEGVVTSFRKVKWTSFEPNFFILFQPGVLDEAPKTFLGSFKVNGIEERKAVFKLVANTFPSASLLEVSEVIRKITEIFNLMTFAIRAIAYLSLFVALVVVCAVSFNHLELKTNEMRLFYLLGLDNTKRKKIYRVESFLQIFLSMSLAVFFGSLLSYGVLFYGFNFEVDYNWLEVTQWILVLFIILQLVVNFKISQLISNVK